MMTNNLIVVGVLAVLMAAVSVVFFYVLRIKFLNRAISSMLRLVLWIAVFGVCAYALLRIDNVLLSLLWELFVVLFAAWNIVRRARLRRQHMLFPVAIALFAAVIVCLLPMFVYGPVWRAHILIPVSGLLVAISSTILPRALREYFVALVRFSDTYYYLLGNGSSWLQAVAPMLKRAADRAFLPVFKRTALVGFVGLCLLLTSFFLVPNAAEGVAGLGSPASYAGLCLGFLLLLASSLACGVLAFSFVVLLSQKKVTDKRGHLSDIVRL